eukprot:7790819-Pyramimonas_sp.AAC.1
MPPPRVPPGSAPKRSDKNWAHLGAGAIVATADLEVDVARGRLGLRADQDVLGLVDSLGPALLPLGLLGGGFVLALALSSQGDGRRGLDRQSGLGGARVLLDLAQQRAHYAQLEGVALDDLLA